MAQAASFTLADGQGTPVNVTFAPEKVTPEVSTFVDRLTGIASRFRRVSARYSPASNSRATNKSSLEVSYPVWGTLPSGAVGILYTLRGKVEFVLPDGSTDAERKDLYAFVQNGLSNTLLRGNLRDLDPLY